MTYRMKKIVLFAFVLSLFLFCFSRVLYIPSFIPKTPNPIPRRSIHHKVTHKDTIDDFEGNRDILTKYNVVVFNGERACCGGTVVKSTPEETLILTASHCIWNKDKTPMEYGYIQFDNDDKYRVEVEAYNRNQDLALLRVTDGIEEKDVAPIAEDSPMVGDKIWVVGYGAGVEDIMSQGIVSKSNTKSIHAPETHCILIDASVYYGNSGGGVYNDDNELIGVVIQIGPQHPTQGLWAYAVHPEEIKEFLAPYLQEN